MQPAALKLTGNYPKRNTLAGQYLRHKYLILMMLPVLVYYGIFQYGPLYGIIIAFKDYLPFKGILGSEWVGLKQFQDVFNGLFFWTAFRNTLIISFYKLLFGFPAPIILCLIFNEVRQQKLKKMFQSIAYLPHFISWIVLSGLVIEMLSPSRGPINILLQQLGLDPIYFVAEEHWFRPVLVSSGIWRNVGWDSIIFIAAVSSIDPELYDVAEMDGAGRLRKIWNITLPSIMPVISIMLIFSAGDIISDDFDQIFNLYNAKVMSVGDVLSTYTYREGLKNFNYSFATAVGLFRNVIAFILVMLSNYVARKKSNFSLF